MSERINLILADGTADLMTKLAGGERRRGQWLSDLVKAMNETQQQAQASSLDELKLAFIGLAGNQKMLEGRLQQVEGQLAALMSRQGI